MLYLIPWFLLLGFAILAIPIAALLDSRKHKSANAAAWSDDEPMDDDPMQAGQGEDHVEVADNGFGDDGGFGEIVEVDDASAFGDPTQ